MAMQIIASHDIATHAPGETALGLARCPYRQPWSRDLFRCDAGDGVLVSAADCCACPIPDAISHPQVCLYLTPLRNGNEAHFACRWFFFSAREATVRDWRELCFCPYWFPRGPDERLIIARTAPRRTHYLRVLRGEESRRRTADPKDADEGLVGDRAAPARNYWTWLLDRWRGLARGVPRRR